MDKYLKHAGLSGDSGKGKKLVRILERYRQEHVLEHIGRLSGRKKDRFIKEASALDLKLVLDLYSEISRGRPSRPGYARIDPPRVYRPTEPGVNGMLYGMGETSIGKGENGVLIVAGGQATRLRYPYPKGMYPVTPVKKKSLFMLLSEKVRAVSLRYGADIPLLIMTNPESDILVKRYFEKNGFFGLGRKNVLFFQQELLPSVSPGGKLVIREDGLLASSPDGHGGCLKAAFKSGVAGKLKERGIRRLFYCHVDNPLVKVLDPLFLGYHLRSEADFSLKTVRKRPGEKVGTFLYADGKAAVVEYIELNEVLDERGSSHAVEAFDSGSIGVHLIELSFMESLFFKSGGLPYHRQEKELQVEGGKRIGIWKFETFIFDAIPFAGKVSCMETSREEEFAPLKNFSGMDSPRDVREAMSSLHRKWLTSAGIRVKEKTEVEISPLFALDESDFARKMKGRKLLLQGKSLYIE